MANDLHARLLAEIERREDHAGQMSYYEVPWAERETAYLGALREVVGIHADVPTTITYSDGRVVEARECQVCIDGDCGEVCGTLVTVAEALGVEP